ncbi:carbonic anhydrase 1 [Drosophila nasuta]|uniref:carbonic anhydrase 1 n=1 Tax=Drosophila nasuta TaxID=42062 RepID=UPI00295EAA14|nr:carbonic anhydrase 1 [Drosophila nasuta]
MDSITSWINSDFFSGLSQSIMQLNVYLLLFSFVGALLVLYNCRLFYELICSVDCDEQQGAGDRLVDVPGFDYGISNGPHTWQSADNNQSPINIETSDAVLHCFDNPLLWLGYDVMPSAIRLQNDGRTLKLHAAYPDEIPSIDGCDLLGSFSFHEISFRWSWYNETGSEHTVDNEHFPMEMQCLHTDATDHTHASSHGILIVSYMFSVSTDNPYLDVIIQHLVSVQSAGRQVEIPPFPLRYLMPAFYTDFYSYHGSLTEPPCHRGAEWFISPMSLAISERQLHEFRKLRNRSGTRISRNARPVQPLCDRDVFFNRYESGRR